MFPAGHHDQQQSKKNKKSWSKSGSRQTKVQPTEPDERHNNTLAFFKKKNTHVKYNKMPDKDKGIERKRNNTKLYQEKSCKLYNYCGTLHMERIDCKFCLPSPVDLLSGMLEGIICLMANEDRTWEICIWEICGELMLSTCMSVGHKGTGTGLGLGDGADQTSLKN